MKRINLYLVLCITIITQFFFLSSIRAQAIGSIPGQFSTSATGGAVYSIPIDIPVALSDVAPSLSLVYNSQSGNGIAGLGWNISGLSAITRTRKTAYFDDTEADIMWSTTPATADAFAFAMDGVRLIQSSTNRTDSVIYYLENDPTMKIVAYNIQNDGPRYFRVYTKSGMTLTYGSTTTGTTTPYTMHMGIFRATVTLLSMHGACPKLLI